MAPVLVLALCRAGIVRARVVRGRWWVYRGNSDAPCNCALTLGGACVAVLRGGLDVHGPADRAGFVAGFAE